MANLLSADLVLSKQYLKRKATSCIAADGCQLNPQPPRRSLVAQYVPDDEALAFDIEMQINRSSPINAVELLFSRQSGGSLGYLLLEHRNGDKLALRGIHVAPKHRGLGLSRLFLGCWLIICFKLNLKPTTNRMEKPLISLALQKFCFEPVNHSTPLEVARAPSSDGKVVCWDRKGNLHTVLLHTHLRKQNLVIVAEEPAEHRTVYIRTEFNPIDWSSLQTTVTQMMSGKFSCFSTRMLATASLFIDRDCSQSQL